MSDNPAELHVNIYDQDQCWVSGSRECKGEVVAILRWGSSGTLTLLEWCQGGEGGGYPPLGKHWSTDTPEWCGELGSRVTAGVVWGGAGIADAGGMIVKF